MHRLHNKIFIVAILLLLFSLTGNAQSKRRTTGKPTTTTKKTKDLKSTPDGKILNMLIDEYVQRKSEGNEVTSTLAKINDLYKKLSDSEQAEFLSMIYEPASTAYSGREYGKANALLELYEFFAPGEDANLEDVYYWRGDIASIDPFDTIQIKKSIEGLHEFNNDKSKEYISKLNGYLESIRSYVPLSQSLDGLWVSDIIGVSGLPWLVLKCEPTANGTVSIKIMPYCGFAQASSNPGDYAQNVQDNGLNTLYTCFCSDKLTSMPQTYQAMIQGAGNFMGNYASNKLANKLGYSFGGQMASSMASGLIDLGVNAAFDAIFTPRKRIHIIELNFTQVNKDMLCGQSHYRYVYIKGDDEPKIKDTDQPITFYRWNPELGLAFATESMALSTNTEYKLVSYYDDDFPSNKEMKRRKADKDWKLRDDYLILSGTNAKPKIMVETTTKDGKTETTFVYPHMTYNVLQLKKLIYNIEQNARNNGIPLPARKEGLVKVAFLGVLYSDIADDEKMAKKYPSQKGALVKDIVVKSPAALFGIEKDDIITAVDGFQITDRMQFGEFLKTLNPYDQINISIIRKGKQITVPVVLSYIEQSINN